VVFLCLLPCVAGWRAPPALAQNGAVTINVDAGADRRPISPLIIGWVAKLGPNRAKLASFSIAKYGPQTGNYTFTNVPAGRKYTIKPAKGGFAFSPTARSISNLSANVAAGAATNFKGSGP